MSACMNTNIQIWKTPLLYRKDHNLYITAYPALWKESDWFCHDLQQILN